MSRRTWVLIGVAWLAMTCVVVGLLVVARSQLIARLSRPDAQADWERWQQEEAARQANPETPVKRRPPKSAQPPAFVLMRDSFPAVVAALLVVTTLCFAFAVMSLHGFGRGTTAQRHRPPRRPDE
jgi:hypothetical protein